MSEPSIRMIFSTHGYGGIKMSNSDAYAQDLGASYPLIRHMRKELSELPEGGWQRYVGRFQLQQSGDWIEEWEVKKSDYADFRSHPACMGERASDDPETTILWFDLDRWRQRVERDRRDQRHVAFWNSNLGRLITAGICAVVAWVSLSCSKTAILYRDYYISLEGTFLLIGLLAGLAAIGLLVKIGITWLSERSKRQ
jgi:hypothetical protein